MQIIPTEFEGCFIIQLDRFEDDRGVFFEAFNKKDFNRATGLNIDFVQDNVSISKKGVLRGLHFQKAPYEQAKLVQVLRGEVLDVIVDLREDSKTYGKHLKFKLCGKVGKAIFIPKGMAHGFLAFSSEVVFHYKCDQYYQPNSESGIYFGDEDLSIDWNYDKNSVLVSEKDSKLGSFASLIK